MNAQSSNNTSSPAAPSSAAEGGGGGGKSGGKTAGFFGSSGGKKMPPGGAKGSAGDGFDCELLLSYLTLEFGRVRSLGGAGVRSVTFSLLRFAAPSVGVGEWSKRREKREGGRRRFVSRQTGFAAKGIDNTLRYKSIDHRNVKNASFTSCNENNSVPTCLSFPPEYCLWLL